MRDKLKKFKSNVKHYAPEIIVATSLTAGTIMAVFLIDKSRKGEELYIAIDRDKVDHTLVLELQENGTFKDLDFGQIFDVTPIV